MRLVRARKDEIPEQQHWDIDAVGEIERARIIEWIKEEARKNLRQPNASRDSALQAASVVNEEVAGFFAGLEEHQIVDPDLVTRAANGELRQAAPSLGWVRTSNFFRWLLMVAEVAVFAGLWLFGGNHPAVIIPGLLLAVGGWSLGWGVGQKLQLTSSDEARRQQPRLLEFAAIGAGIAAIGGVTYMRAKLGGEEAMNLAIVTLVLALLISLFEAAYEYSSDKYERLRDEMYRAQASMATKRHRSDAETEFWASRYKDEVNRVVGGYTDVEGKARERWKTGHA